jgi:hypothetical protein
MAFLGVGHPSLLTGIRSLLATEADAVFMTTDDMLDSG